jgi:hypothetical protein
MNTRVHVSVHFNAVNFTVIHVHIVLHVDVHCRPSFSVNT